MALEKRIHALETRSAVEEVHRMNVENRLKSIEDSLSWLLRLVVGALIMAGVAYALNGGLALAGG